jgi:AGCS family alanine or glycine:cation symporter
VILPYRMLWLILVYVGSIGSLHVVWDIADTLNGLMAIPNLIAVLASTSAIAKALKSYAMRR